MCLILLCSEFPFSHDASFKLRLERLFKKFVCLISSAV